MEGWIKLHRKIKDCFIWEDKPYDKARAWIDLLLSAMHKDKKMMIDGKVVVVKKGSFATSILKLSDRWGWSRKKTTAFIKMLENEKMVTTMGTPKGTTITIVNYEKYQVEGATKDTTEDTPQETTGGTTKDTTEDTQNKNIKNDKNDKKENSASASTESDLNALFEDVWKLYPNKKGKGQVSKAAKERLLKVGYEELARAIDRYKSELEKDSDWRKPQNGSTFFNSGYVDYLDANYEPLDSTTASRNQFNNYSGSNDKNVVNEFEKIFEMETERNK